MPAKKSDPPENTGAGLSRQDIERLIDVIHQKGIEELELEQGGTRLRIVSGGRSSAMLVNPANPGEAAPPPALQVTATPSEVAGTSSTPGKQPEEDARYKKITSPMVGTFYRSASPGAKSFVEVGDRVDEDSVLCIIEAMKLMNEIKAEMRGTIKKILVENAQPVEYGQALFLVDPS
jgi:acetyl-CoA carboxylase biotin carboxyl carrier protein